MLMSPWQPTLLPWKHLINCASANTDSSVRCILRFSGLFIPLTVLPLHLAWHYYASPCAALTDSLPATTKAVASHCTDLPAYLSMFTFSLHADMCSLPLLQLFSTQPPPALVQLCSFAPWRTFPKLITIRGLIFWTFPIFYVSPWRAFQCVTVHHHTREPYCKVSCISIFICCVTWQDPTEFSWIQNGKYSINNG